MWAVLVLAAVFVGTCSARNTNIINGVDVSPPGKYPWQGSLQYQRQFFCGASVVGDKWLVTAAHCVSGRHKSHFTIVLGLHDKAARFGQPKRYTIKNIHQHESYNRGGGTMGNDIAVIELDQNIEFNKFVKKIELDRSGDFDGNSDCVISGWGYTIPGSKYGKGHTNANVLQETPTKIITPSECTEAMKGIGSINSGQICVRSGSSGACMGDSGGPLHCRNEGEDYKLVGATSWGLTNCQTHSPSIYTRVSYFIDWVDSKTGGSTGSGTGGTTSGSTSGGIDGSTTPSSTGGGGSTVGGSNCSDSVSSCAQWVKYCQQASFANFMKKNCAKTCGFPC